MSGPGGISGFESLLLRLTLASAGQLRKDGKKIACALLKKRERERETETDHSPRATAAILT